MKKIMIEKCRRIVEECNYLNEFISILHYIYIILNININILTILKLNILKHHIYY